LDITASSGTGGTSIARSRGRVWPTSMMVHQMMVQELSREVLSIPDARPGPLRKARAVHHQKVGDFLDGFLRRRQTDAQQRRWHSDSSRSSDSARCEPRLLPAMA
jgi:hypothetical protein